MAFHTSRLWRQIFGVNIIYDLETMFVLGKHTNSIVASILYEKTPIAHDRVVPVKRYFILFSNFFTL